MPWKQFPIVFLLFLTACNASSTQTGLVAEAMKPTWTFTPEPTMTITPSLTPTATQFPTRTPNLMETAIKATEGWASRMWVQLHNQSLLVCQGQGAPEAGDYNPSVNEINPSVICRMDSKSCTLPSFIFDYFINENVSKLDPKEISELQLVICVEQETEVMGRCAYTYGMTLDRVRYTDKYSVISARTGQKLNTFPVTSGMPPACPPTITIGDGSSLKLSGDSPDKDDLFNKLNRYFHLAAE